MKAEKIEQDILKINQQVCFDLWNIANVKSGPSEQSPRLILPQKRDESIRISEQESRILYCGTLNMLDYYYSIETPTEQKYIQSGKTPVSASSDMSLYIHREKDKENSSFEKIVNIEFKAHNPDYEHLRKDIEKLVRERLTGNWFHTLKNVDSGTLPSLFEKFKKSFIECAGMTDGQISIIFCFCVMEKGWACLKHFLYDPGSGSIEKYTNDFFKLDYSVKLDNIEVNNNENWSILTKDHSL